MRPEGKATDTRLEMPASEAPAACPGGEASSLPAVEGEADMPVTIASLPAEGGRLRRPPAWPALNS